MSEPITLTQGTPQQLMDLFDRRSKSMLKSRSQRIIRSRDIRRGVVKLQAPAEWRKYWKTAKGLTDAIEVLLPHRGKLDRDLKQSIYAMPDLLRTPTGRPNDTAEEYADLLESHMQSLRDDYFPADTIYGKLIEDGECGFRVIPKPADPLSVPEMYEKDGTTIKPRYHRDAKERSPQDKSYSGTVNVKKSKDAFTADHLAWKANHVQLSVQCIPALDCVPIFKTGMANERFELDGLIQRSLYDREDLIESYGYGWDGMNDALIPRGHGADYGVGGQIYLYQYHRVFKAKDGSWHPATYSCVGGRDTWCEEAREYEVDGKKKQRNNAETMLVDYYEEYGLCEPLWTYLWGMHTDDDDPDYRGKPYIYDLINTMLNLESVLMAHNAAMWDRSFRGDWIKADKDMPPEALLESPPGGPKRMRTFDTPRFGEAKLAPGDVQSANTGPVGNDASAMESAFSSLLAEAAPAPEQTGEGDQLPSGHAGVVGHSLYLAAKSDIRTGVAKGAEFFASRALMIERAFALGEGKLEADPPAVWVVEQVEQEDLSEPKTANTPQVFNPSWVGQDYTMHAEYPEESNLAKVAQEAQLKAQGLATFEDVQKARGKKSSETERIKIARDRYLETDPAAQAMIRARVLARRGDYMGARMIELQIKGVMTSGGMPTSAIPDELMGAAQGQQSSPAGSLVQPPGALQASGLPGIVQGAVGTASRTADAQAQMQMGAA